MSFGQEPKVPANGPVDTQGPPSLTFARPAPPKSRYRQVVPRRQAKSLGEGKEEEESDAEAGNGPPAPPSGGPAPPPGGGDGDPLQDGDEDDEEEDE